MAKAKVKAASAIKRVVEAPRKACRSKVQQGGETVAFGRAAAHEAVRRTGE